MSSQTGKPHVCLPDLETLRALRTGERSSIKRTCVLCRKESTWIQHVNGEIAILRTRGPRA